MCGTGGISIVVGETACGREGAGTRFDSCLARIVVCHKQQGTNSVWGISLGSVWGRLGVVWDRFGMVLRSCWDRFWIVVGLSWDSFGIIGE